jgi:hypothetical protein
MATLAVSAKQRGCAFFCGVGGCSGCQDAIVLLGWMC